MGRLKLMRKAGGLRGPVPTEPFERVELIIEKRPTDEWQAANREALERGDIVEPDDEDLVMGVNIYGFYVIPQRNVPPALWKQGRTLMLTLQEQAFTEFRAECMADLDRQRPPEQTAEEHRAELGEIGEKALAAHRAAKQQLSPEADALRAPPPSPWWRRVFGA